MPIGFDAGDIGSTNRVEASRIPTAFEEAVRAGQPVIAAVWTRWRTAEDERVCPECGPLDGIAWPIDEGPQPPLHNHCRCVRETAFVEWVTVR